MRYVVIIFLIPQLFNLPDGNCLKSRAEKFLCQKCRLDKCLEIGMDTKQILSEVEKRERFQSYFKRKDEEERLKQELRLRAIEATEAKIKKPPRPILPKYVRLLFSQYVWIWTPSRSTCSYSHFDKFLLD